MHLFLNFTYFRIPIMHTCKKFKYVHYDILHDLKVIVINDDFLTILINNTTTITVPLHVHGDFIIKGRIFFRRFKAIINFVTQKSVPGIILCISEMHHQLPFNLVPSPLPRYRILNYTFIIPTHGIHISNC